MTQRIRENREGLIDIDLAIQKFLRPAALSQGAPMLIVQALWTIAPIRFIIPMPSSGRAISETVSVALERLRNIENIVASWDERLRICEQRQHGNFQNQVTTSPGDMSSSSSHASMIPARRFQPVRTNCAVKSCLDEVMTGKRFCQRHISRACQYADCSKTRLGPHFCIRHGGGKRCQVDGCNKGASGTIGGGAKYCIAHGGGRRCRVNGCHSTAKRGGLCSAHGGRYECQIAGCKKTAHGPLRLCISHGGGRSHGPQSHQPTVYSSPPFVYQSIQS